MSRHITWEITVLFTPVLCTSYWWESSIKSSEILEDVVVNQCGHCYKLFTGSSITIITRTIKPEYNGFFLNTSYFDKPTKQDRIIKFTPLNKDACVWSLTAGWEPNRINNYVDRRTCFTSCNSYLFYRDNNNEITKFKTRLCSLVSIWTC